MESPMYSNLQLLLNEFHSRYPYCVQPSIGYSVLGEPIQLFRIGKGDIHIHINAAIHANEWLTSFVLIRFALWLQALLVKEMTVEVIDSEWKSYMQKCSLWIVPVVNPDGVRLVMDGCSEDDELKDKWVAWNHGSSDFSGWKANANGVDLNDQFPAGWERERVRRQIHGVNDGPRPRDYGGTEPLTEPEARALARHVRMMPFATVLALHTQGSEIYWNYAGLEPKHAESFAIAMATECGYRAVALTDSDAGFKDWFIAFFRRPGFTIELGIGNNPLPYEQATDLLEHLKKIILACLRQFLHTSNAIVNNHSTDK